MYKNSVLIVDSFCSYIIYIIMNIMAMRATHEAIVMRNTFLARMSDSSSLFIGSSPSFFSDNKQIACH